MKLALVLFRYGVPIDDPCCYPLGFMYISAVLKGAGNDVTVVNLNLESSHICVKDYDAVIMTGFEEFLPAIRNLAAVCRLAGVKTILGGALATFRPQEMAGIVDTVVVGEGETAILQALDRTGTVLGGKPDLSALPLPDYEGFGIEEYHKRHGIRYMGVLTSRGCPHDCKFCAHTCSFNCRRLSDVFAEIDAYRAKYDLQVVVFNDNTLNISESRFLQICAGMKERGLKWTAAIRCDVFTEDMARAAKESGCAYSVVGVESFNQDKLDAMNKGLKVADVVQTLDLLHKYGIKYHGNILFGFPGETFEDIAAEIDAMPKGYNVFPVLVRPFVGTAVGASTLSPEEYQELDVAFKSYAKDSGKYYYPDLEAA